MRTFIPILCAFVVTVTALTVKEEWKNFKSQYGKSYLNQAEESRRFATFQENLQKIREHNERYNNGETSFTLGINHFADMSAEEFQTFLGFQSSYKSFIEENKEYFVSEPSYTPPDFVNWTAAGAVTEVKNQENCGSCWSFSTVGNIEGQYFQKTGKLVSFSAQNLVDCDSTCGGCQGGYMDRALEYIEKNGIYTEEDYPYCGIKNTCVANKSDSLVKVSSYAFVKRNDEIELQKAVATIGPISVAIDATFWFQFYRSGVLNDTTCDDSLDFLNHAVLAVGYGTENGKDYWLVKNSWGSRWGDNGFIKMSRNAKNQCGIATFAITATL